MDSSPRRQKFSIEYNGIKYDCERIIHGKQVFRQTIQGEHSVILTLPLAAVGIV